MNKIKEFMREHKIFFTILFVAIALLGLEYVVVNNYVDKKTSPKKNKTSNITSNLSDKQKKTLGIASNSNNAAEENNSVTNTIIEEKKEKKKEELSNSNLNKNYVDYEKLSDEEKAKIDVIPSKEKVDIDKLDKIDDKTTTTIPAKFDLGDIINLNFDDQGSYGLCWDFASTKVFETYLALNYKKEYNFSEIAVDYLASPKLYNLTPILHEGGNFDIYNSLVNRIGGLIETKNIKYDYYHDYTEEEYKDLLTLPRVTINNYEVVRFPTLYSADTKMYDSSNNEVSNEELIKYRDTMKNHIMNNSALFIVLSGESTTYSTSENIKLSEEYNKISENGQRTFFCKDEDCNWRKSSHAMAIIGWDDNFDRRMFKQIDRSGKEYYPEKNGAFILANSWSDKKDYYYVSYEDDELYLEMTGIKKVDSSDMSKYLNVTNLNEGFKEELSSYIKVINNQEYVLYDDLASISFLELSDYNLTNNDLNILKYFTNLEYLNISNNNISDISSLYSLKELINLDASNNNITDISILTSLPKLEGLYLENNNISDITPIKNLYKLNILELNNNKLINYSNVFENLNELTLLSLDNCNIGDITFGSNDYMSLNLSNNPNLKLLSKVKTNIIELDNNNLSSLDILSNIDASNLRNLSLVNNDIKDISVLTNYKSLSSLNLSGNKNITNIDKIKEIFGTKDKEENNSDSNGLKDAAVSLLGGTLNSIKKLVGDEEEHIDIDDNESQDESMGMYQPPENELFLNNCNISDITIFNNLNVSTLSLTKNNITNIDDFKNINVSYLYLSDNQINNIDFDKLITEKLDELYLSNVGLKEIKLSKTINKSFISILDLSNNDITDISNLNGITNINILSLENNVNFKNYNLTNEVNYINLANTSVDDTIIDKIDFNNIYLINLSNNKNISDANKLVTGIKNKCNEINNKVNSEEYDDENENGHFTWINLVLDGFILNISPYDEYVSVDANYVITLDKESDGTINLLKGNNFSIFKLLISRWNYKTNNMSISKDLTKMNITENSYITLSGSSDLAKEYIIKFN